MRSRYVQVDETFTRLLDRDRGGGRRDWWSGQTDYTSPGDPHPSPREAREGLEDARASVKMADGMHGAWTGLPLLVEFGARGRNQMGRIALEKAIITGVLTGRGSQWGRGYPV
jgi:hypothetical protein